MSALTRAWAFGGVSGIGWLLDTALFALLAQLGPVPAGPANVLSAGVAVCFVFLVTHERLFGGTREQRRRHLLAYVAAQVVLVLLASLAIGALVQVTGAAPLLVKIAVTPFTLALNFLTMTRITRRPAPQPAAGRTPRPAHLGEPS